MGLLCIHANQLARFWYNKPNTHLQRSLSLERICYEALSIGYNTCVVHVVALSCISACCALCASPPTAAQTTVIFILCHLHEPSLGYMLH